MSVITHRTLICDRCGTITEAHDPSHEFPWGMMEAGRVDGSEKIGPVDICPGCLMGLQKWFRDATTK